MQTITKLSDLAKAVTIASKRGEDVLSWDKRDQWQKALLAGALLSSIRIGVTRLTFGRNEH